MGYRNTESEHSEGDTGSGVCCASIVKVSGVLAKELACGLQKDCGLKAQEMQKDPERALVGASVALGRMDSRNPYHSLVLAVDLCCSVADSPMT